MTIILTCEHAGARVPRQYARLFRSRAGRQALASHRGFDLGALDVARSLARRFRWPLYACRTTRLLVDVNRSIGHRHLHSEFAARLDPAARTWLLARIYRPHRRRVSRAIAGAVASGHRVLHLGIHTFAPIRDGIARHTDIGLLYDPARAWERGLSAHWRALVARRAPAVRVRRNYPYLGRADGLTTTLRRQFADGEYAGLEVEINQALTASGTTRGAIVAVLRDTLTTLVGVKAN